MTHLHSSLRESEKRGLAMPEPSQVNEILHAFQPILWAVAIIAVVLVLMWAIAKIADDFKI